MPRPNPWTPELDALLRAARAVGVTYTELGRRLGVSKSTVAGRIHRLGIKAPPEEDRAPRENAAIFPDEGRYDLMDLPTKGCRWPHGDGPFTFCGEPAARGNPYCPAHRARAHWR